MATTSLTLCLETEYIFIQMKISSRLLELSVESGIATRLFL